LIGNALIPLQIRRKPSIDRGRLHSFSLLGDATCFLATAVWVVCLFGVAMQRIGLPFLSFVRTDASAGGTIGNVVL
jgi:hypothetical protein